MANKEIPTEWISNTFTFPKFVTDDGITLRKIKGNPLLKVYLILLRHCVGFISINKSDEIKLTNKTISDKTGVSIRDVIKYEKQLRDRYELIHYETSKGGREVKNIKILLPPEFYTKAKPNLDEAKKLLEANGFKVEAPGDKSRQEKKSTSDEIKAWNNFIGWGNTHLSRAGKEQVSKLKVSVIDRDELMLTGELTNMQKGLIEKYFKEISTDGIIINFKEGDK